MKFSWGKMDTRRLKWLRAVQKPIHLALLDIRMPMMSGPELLVELLDCLVPRELRRTGRTSGVGQSFSATGDARNA